MSDDVQSLGYVLCSGTSVVCFCLNMKHIHLHSNVPDAFLQRLCTSEARETRADFKLLLLFELNNELHFFLYVINITKSFFVLLTEFQSTSQENGAVV